MRQNSQKMLLPILVIGERSDEIRRLLSRQNRSSMEASTLQEGIRKLQFGSFVTILCDWDAIRNGPCDISICQAIRDINRLGLPLLIHSPQLATGLRFQFWNGFYFYHFRTQLVSPLLPKIERLALQFAVQNYPRSLPATHNQFASLDPESGWSLTPPPIQVAPALDLEDTDGRGTAIPPTPHFRIGEIQRSPARSMNGCQG